VERSSPSVERAEGGRAPRIGARFSVALSIAASGALFLAFLAVTALVTRGMTDAFDARLLLWVQAHLLDPLVWLWQAVSWPGYAPQSYGIAAMMLYLGWGYAGRRGLLLVLLALASQLLGTVVKHLVQRPRPTPEAARVIGEVAHSASYPSGHVLTYTVILGIVALLIRDALPASGWARRRDRALCALFVALIVLVGPSRVALGQHWPMDVVGAYLLGGAALALLARWRRPA
jgi:membrane-associated phospholipid phosphatase